VGSDVEREMVARAGAESPAAGRAVRLVVQDERFSRTAGANLEPVIRTVSPGLPESERLNEKPFLLGGFAHRQHGSVKSARRNIGADLAGRPAGPRVVRVLDDLHQQPRWVPQPDERLAEPLLRLTVIDRVAAQVIGPEGKRPLRDGERRG